MREDVGTMVKGSTRQVILVKSPDPKLFEEAIFLVREEAIQREGVTADQVIRHYDVTGKNCPKYYVENPDAWLQMKADIAAQINVDYGLQG